MNKPRFLLDECTTPALIAALRQLEPGIDVIRVGDAGAPPSGTKDPDLLIAAEALGRVLVSNDKKSLPRHLANHYAAGRHTAGIMLMRKNFPLIAYAQAIQNHWATTSADDWIDRTVFIP